jgi:hypothetical protein
MKHLKNLIGLLLFCLLTSSIALAQNVDPFLSETENDGNYESEIRETLDRADEASDYKGALAELPNVEQSLEKKKEFKGPIERLLQSAGEDPAAAQNDWQDFEQLEPGTKEKYFQTPEWKVRSELSKPIRRKNPFGDKLGSIEQSLGELNRNQKDLEHEYGDKSKYSPNYKPTDDDNRRY